MRYLNVLSFCKHRLPIAIFWVDTSVLNAYKHIFTMAEDALSLRRTQGKEPIGLVYCDAYKFKVHIEHMYVMPPFPKLTLTKYPNIHQFDGSFTFDSISNFLDSFHSK